MKPVDEQGTNCDEATGGAAEEPLGECPLFAQRVTQAMPDVLHVFDLAEQRNIYANRQITDILGYSPDEAQAMGADYLPGLLHPDNLTCLEDARARSSRLADGEVLGFTYRMRHKNGSWRWIHSRETVFERAEDGTVRQVLGVAQDLTEWRQAEDAARASAAKYRSLVGLLADWVWELDGDGRYTFVSPQVTGVLGYLPGEVVGRTPFDLMPPEEAERLRDFTAQLVAERRPFAQQECRVLHKDGRQVHVEVSGTPLFDADGAFIGYRGVTRDITARKALEVQKDTLLADAVRRADHDPLTDLLNRRAFHRRLAEETARTAQTGQPLALVMLDLDNFKFFNEAYGHLAGDEVLCLVAEVLRDSAETAGGAAIRLGGDEFAVLLPGRNQRGAEEWATRLKRRLQEAGYRPPSGAAAPVPLAVSAGAAALPADADTPGALVAAADARLAESKVSRRDFWSDELRRGLRETVPGFAMLDGLVAAVHARDRYTLHHSEDVLIHAVHIGETLRLGKAELMSLRAAALLHDVGKIGIPDRILRLPGALSRAEFDLVKQHPAMGAALVGAVPGLEHIVPAVRHHHEAWDGSGYPDGLAGREIPLHARILAVADAYSAMTTDRPYRAGISPAEAEAVLVKGAGRQWDPDCVAALARTRGEAARVGAEV
jgi:diguanylate cyclase (GGDEF)-like protein/PAS domain S-box-containing protein